MNRVPLEERSASVVLIGIAFLSVCLPFLSAKPAVARTPVWLSLQNRQAEAKQKKDERPATLEVGKPIEREIEGGKVHFYKIIIPARQFLQLVVYQRGIDVMVRLYGPDGTKALEVDSPNGAFGPEAY